DYHIQISASPTDGGDCLIVEIPDPADPAVEGGVQADAKRFRQWIRTELLRGKQPSTAGSGMKHPPYVEVTGVLFYDASHVGTRPRGKKGMLAGTLWELHPVRSIKFAPLPMS